MRVPAHSPLDVDLVRRFTGQVTVVTTSEATRLLSDAKDRLRSARRSARRLKLQYLKAIAKRQLARFRIVLAVLPLRVRLDRWLIASVLALIASIVGAALAFSLYGDSLATVLGTALVPFMLVPLSPVLFPSADLIPELARRRDDAAIGSGWAARRLKDLQPELRTASEQVRYQRRLLEGLKQAENFPLQRLLKINFQNLDGTGFERFLADVFMYLGYNVQLTGQAGDQGVDLIIEHEGVRTAVQAKCYSGAVNNAAVQQAFAGAAYHRCHRCAVVTSSYFTKSAHDIAVSTGCRLVRGDEIHDLLRGRILL